MALREQSWTVLLWRFRKPYLRNAPTCSRLLIRGMWRTVITNWWFKCCNLTTQSLDPSRLLEINMTVSVSVTSLTRRKINCLTWETDTKTLSETHHFPSGGNLQLSNCYGGNVFCVSSQITHQAATATYSVKLVPLWLDFLLSPTHSCLKPCVGCVVINMV